MSGEMLVTPTMEGAMLGFLLDLGLKSTVALGLSLVTVRLGSGWSAAARHRVLAFGLASVPAIAVASALTHPELVWGAGISGAVARGLVAAYLCGVALVGLPVARGLVALRRVARQASDATWLTPSDREDLTVRQAPVAVPLAFGWRRPTVLFPSGAATWTEAERAAALAHERAHVDRRDWPVQLAVHAVAALAWFQPLVWVARAQLRLAAEQAADDAVLGQGVAPRDYARHLLDRSAELSSLGTVAMSLGRPSQLEQRIRAILADRPRGASRAAAWLTAAIATLLAVPVAGASWMPEPEPAAPGTGAATCNPTPEAEAAEIGSVPWALREARAEMPVDIDHVDTPLDARIALRHLIDDLGRSAPTHRAKVGDAASTLVRTCPYRRAGVQVVSLLSDELDELVTRLPVGGDGMPEVLAQRLTDLRDLTVLHGQLFDALGLRPLPRVRPLDQLADDPGYLRDVDAIGTSTDRIAAALVVLPQVKEKVAELGDDDMVLIESASWVFEEGTEEFLLRQLTRIYDAELHAIRYHTAVLRRQGAPNAAEWQQRLDVVAERLSVIMQDYSNQGC